MKLRKVKIEEIQVPEVRVTARFDPELWEQFQGSMKETGQIAPIICYEVDEKFVLVDGLHRMIEARANGETTIDAVVIPGDMIDVLTKNIFLDHLRGKTPVSEMVKVIKSLWEEYQLDSEKIATKTGLTRDYVEKLQKIAGLTPMILEGLDQGLIGVGHAFALTKLTDPIQQETVYQQLRLYRWNVKELEGYIKDVMELQAKQAAPGQPAVERPPMKIRCAYCNGEYEVYEIANPNTCRSCSGIMFGSIAQAKADLAAEEAAKKATTGV